MKKFCFILLLLLTGNLVLQAQYLDSLLLLQQQGDPREKMYVHFDKHYYNPGETIWFKAYLFAGSALSLSKNFYAELRNEKGELIDKKTAPVIFSSAASSFDLPDSFPSSSVVFRAYTVSMLNGDSAYIYSKPLAIIHLNKKMAATKKVNQPTEIKFLPEGGELVAGLQNVVAFKTTGAEESPVESSGAVLGPDGKQVATFRSLHDGMGAFTITPQPGDSYKAVWKDEQGKHYTTPLPAVKENGIVLHVSDTTGAKRFVISRTPDAGAEFQTLHVVGVFNQELVYQARINLSVKADVSALMPVSDLPSGILQITVFNADMKPIAERISFVNNSNYEFDADAWISDLNTGKRELNRAEVKIGDTVTANLSLSITDANLNEPEKFHGNIVTQMLLTGELRGKVHDPYYYFYSTADSTSYYLDLVMLTHGWRRYNWDNVLKGVVPKPEYTENEYLGIKGNLVNATGSAFNQGLMLNGFLMTADSGSTFMMLPVERDGAVKTEGLIFYDTARLYLQFNDKKRDFDPSMLNVSNGLLQANPKQGLATGMQKPVYQPDSLIAARNSMMNKEELKVAAKKFKDAHELQNVTVTARAKTAVQQLDERYASGMFSGDATGFDVMNDPFALGSYSVFQYLQGRVAGLQISMGGGTPSLSWRGGTPMVYLNEMQSDVSMIQSLNMADVAYIKVFNPASAGVIRSSGGGVIAIYTKKGGDATTNVDSKLKRITLNGYSPVKQFYAPDYSSASADAYYENYNTTLYWNPFIILNKANKRFKIQFYNNDITSKFRIVLEGINEEGKLIHVEKVVGKD